MDGNIWSILWQLRGKKAPPAASSVIRGIWETVTQVLNITVGPVTAFWFSILGLQVWDVTSLLMRWRRGRRRDVKVWYLQKGGGWLSGGQCNQDELDINCRKHSSPVNTAGVRAIFLTLCSYNINIRNILILTHSIRSGLVSLSDWISVLKFQPIDKS